MTAGCVLVSVTQMNAVSVAAPAPHSQVMAAQVSAKGRVVTAAYRDMKQFLTQYRGTGFARASSIGDPIRFRAALVSSKVRIDKGLDANAQYDPSDNTMTLSFNPRKVPASGRLEAGQTIWHEMVHKIESQNGDTGGDSLWAERNTEYMTYVTTRALNYLRQMEKAARKGAGDTKIASYWTKFINAMSYAATRLPESAKYPPDLNLMYRWFGFDVDPARISRMYADGLSGLGQAADTRLQRVFGGLSHPQVNGLWTEDTGPCPGAKITIAQSAGTVTAVSMDNTSAAPDCRAAWVASDIRWLDADTLAYRLHFTVRPHPGWYDGRHELTFAADGRRAALNWWDDNGSSGSTNWSKVG